MRRRSFDGSNPVPMAITETNPDLLFRHPDVKGEVMAEHSVANGGGTHREFPENLLKSGTEPWNKWCQCDSKESWVMINLEKKIDVVGIGFKSANDCPHRDPDDIHVSYADQNGEFVRLDHFKPDFH
jgi:hypothetical protein